MKDKTALLLESCPKTSEEGAESTRNAIVKNYKEIEEDLIKDSADRDVPEALAKILGEIELPQHNANLSEGDQDDNEAVVDLLAAEIEGPADMDKYHNVFEGPYRNQDDLLDDYRDKLSTIYQSNSQGRRVAHIVLEEAAFARSKSDCFSAVRKELFKWAEAGYKSPMPMEYYTDNGKPRKRLKSVDPSFKKESEEKDEDGRPALPNHDSYHQVWHECRDPVMKVILVPQISLDDKDKCVLALERCNQLLDEAMRIDKVPIDLKVPFRFMVYLVVQATRNARLTGEEKKKAEQDWKAEHRNLTERVRRARQPGWWATFMKNAVNLAKDNPDLTQENCDILVQKWKDIEANRAPKAADSHHEAPIAQKGDEPDVDMSDAPKSEEELRQDLAALKVKRNEMLKTRGVQATVMDSDGKTQYGKVIGVQRIGRGGFRIALDAGTEKLPVLRVMNPSGLGGMILEWADKFPWPTCDAKRRGRGQLEKIVAILDVPASAAKEEQDAKKKAQGLSVRESITYFWVEWKSDSLDENKRPAWSEGPKYTLTSRSALIAAKLTSDQKLRNVDIPALRQQRKENEECIKQFVALSIHPDTDAVLSSEDKAAMPWLLPSPVQSSPAQPAPLSDGQAPRPTSGVI